MAPSRKPSPPVDAAVLLADSGAAAAFGQRLSGAWGATEGAVKCVGGRLGDRTVVSVVPGKPPVDYQRIINAVVAAHRPARFVAAGVASAPPESAATGQVCLAQRVVGRDGGTVDLAPPAGVDAPCGVVVQPGVDAERPLAECDWAYEAAAACERLGVSVVVLAAVVVDSRRDADPELRNLARQQSLAGRLGAVVGAVWRRPAAAGDMWKRQEERWEAQERLADVLVRVVGGEGAHAAGDLSKTKRRR